MGRFFGSLFAQIREFYRNLTPTKRVSALLAAAVVAVAVAVMMTMVSDRSYVVLLKEVPQETMPTVLAKLKEKNIPFKLGEDGNTILIPPNLLYSTQMAIMSELGSGKIGTMGFELFEKQDFGTTSYQQRVNYQRALQGELVRSINSLEVIRQSKVILAMPPKKTFLEEGGSPTASVVVDLHAGKMLLEEQVRGIQHLVAAAVENLDPEKVTVVDARGKVLSRNSVDPSSQMSAEMIQLKDKTEKVYEERIEQILAKVVGQGRVIARVEAAINNRSVQSVEEAVDPEMTALRSQQTEEEKLDGSRRNPTGIPGARANLPGADETGQVAFNQNVNKEYKILNYEVPKTVRNVKEAPGKLERLSIAVLVDGATSIKTAEDGTKTEEWTPRAAEDIQKYESLIKGAIGFDPKRGDTFSIENIQFQKEDFSESEQLLTSLERRRLISYLVKWSVIGFAFALFFLLVVKPFMRWITESFQESVDEILPKTIEELEELQSVDNSLPGMSSGLPMIEESIDPDKAESDLLKERISALIEKDNKKAANALGLWLVRRET